MATGLVLMATGRHGQSRLEHHHNNSKFGPRHPRESSSSRFQMDVHPQNSGRPWNAQLPEGLIVLETRGLQASRRTSLAPGKKLEFTSCSPVMICSKGTRLRYTAWMKSRWARRRHTYQTSLLRELRLVNSGSEAWALPNPLQRSTSGAKAYRVCSKQ